MLDFACELRGEHSPQTSKEHPKGQDYGPFKRSLDGCHGCSGKILCQAVWDGHPQWLAVDDPSDQKRSRAAEDGYCCTRGKRYPYALFLWAIARRMLCWALVTSVVESHACQEPARRVAKLLETHSLTVPEATY